MGAPSVPPGRYFRMHLVGYFEGIDSERGLEWRCSDSLSLRAFLRLGSRDRVPDHSWLSRSRTRLPHEVHAAVFDWVLVLIAEAGLIKGERIGVDASTMEANAALRNIVRRDNGEGYREMLECLARESGVETPTAENLARLDRKRKGKKLSNTDWVSKSDPEAKIAMRTTSGWVATKRSYRARFRSLLMSPPVVRGISATTLSQSAAPPCGWRIGIGAAGVSPREALRWKPIPTAQGKKSWPRTGASSAAPSGSASPTAMAFCTAAG